MTIQVPIEQIIDPNEGVPLKPESEQLYEDIKANGLKHPLAVFLKDQNGKQIHIYTPECKVIIADGHHRFQIYKRLGYKTVPCDVDYYVHVE